MPKSKRRQTLSHLELENFLDEISTNVPPSSGPHVTDENEPSSNIVNTVEVASVSPVKTGKASQGTVEDKKRTSVPIEDASPDKKAIRLYCKVSLYFLP